MILTLRVLVAVIGSLALGMPAGAAPRHVMIMPLCNGGTVTVDLDGGSVPSRKSRDSEGCCAKACHAGDRRKRLAGDPDDCSCP